MNRRKLLIGLGAAAAGGGTALGTGAFTSVEADRDVSVSVANENNAYLGIEPSPPASPNSEFATQDSSNADQIALNFDDSGNGGSGVGLSSVYDFDDVFRVTNQGTQTVYVWANFSGGDLSDADIWFYPDGESTRKLNDGTNSVVTVPVGETIKMGVHIDTNVLGSTDDETLTATLTADVDVPGGSTPSDGVGEDAAVVSKNPDQGEYSSIQAAIDAVDGTTVYVEPGTYEESVTIDVDGLTLEGPNAGIDGDSDARGSEAIIAEGVDVRASDVTTDGVEIQNPGEQGAADPTDFAGAVGVNIQTDETDVTVTNSVITEVGTNDDDANPIGVYSPDGTSGLTVSNNLIANLEGTDEDEGAIQAVLVDESGTQITGVSVDNNTITDLTDTRSTVAVRFNGDVSGVINDNDITGLNTEGDIPGTNDPGGFTQVISLAKGDASETGPSDVTIEGNEISDIETTTEDNFAPPFHIIIGADADGDTISITDNEFNADSPDTDVYLSDGTGDLNLQAILNDQGNTFDPNATVIDGEDAIVPESQ